MTWTCADWPALMRSLLVALVGCGLSVSVGSGAAGQAPTQTRLARVLNGAPPASIDELKAMQQRIRELTDRILPCTVAVQVGRANGSGVIVNPDGYVLTAAHVIGTPQREATILLPNGTVARGITLGLNPQLDAGLIRITDPGPWPFAPLGRSTRIKAGQWCLATGHPGGFEHHRLPVLRFGRILKSEETAVLTDCTLVGGDSGGPLFDLQGRVIGIHSRIGKNLTINVHVPVDPYRDSWDRLARGEMWGLLEEDAEEGWLGVTEDPDSPQARILAVLPDSPAQQAGLQPGDVVVRLADTDIDSFSRLQDEVRRHPPGERIDVRLLRQEQVHELQVELGHRPSTSDTEE